MHFCHTEVGVVYFYDVNESLLYNINMITPFTHLTSYHSHTFELEPLILLVNLRNFFPGDDLEAPVEELLFPLPPKSTLSLAALLLKGDLSLP